MSRTSVVMILLAAVAAGLPAEAQETEPVAPGPNVVVTINVGKVAEDGAVDERTYRLVAREGGPVSEMLMGWRIPIPASHSGDGDGSSAAVTSYVYQNIGVSATIELRAVDEKRFVLHGNLEISAVRPAAADGPPAPRIGTFQQALSVVLTNGKRLRVAEVPDPEVGTLFVELMAEKAN